MKIINIIEKDDGSCSIEMDMTNEEIQIVLEVGFNKILKDSIEEMEKKFPKKMTRGEEIEETLKRR